jgi:sugar lactone lactonase YvrE
MAYVAILVLLAVISTLAFTLLFKAGTGMLATMTRGNSMQAHYLAESAANHAMWRLLNESEFPADPDKYYMHSLGSGRYGYKVHRHTDTTFATVATVGSVGKNVVQQSYVLYIRQGQEGGEMATDAELDKPHAVHIDGSGNIYIADTDNHRIRKVDAGTGIITTIAGTGERDYSGDGEAATGAELNKPRGIHIDGSGNIYIADTDNHCIRKVDTETGIITTIAGTGGKRGYSGDDGPATEAKLRKPRGIYIDTSGNIYIADTDNHRIRKVDTEGTITTIAGTGRRGYSGDDGPATDAKLRKPRGLYVDTSGNIYIADTDNHRIRKIDTDGIITTIAGSWTWFNRGGYSGDGGPATDAKLRKPRGLYVDTSGNIYIADTDNHRIRKVDAEGIITTVAGTGI